MPSFTTCVSLGQFGPVSSSKNRNGSLIVTMQMCLEVNYLKEYVWIAQQSACWTVGAQYMVAVMVWAWWSLNGGRFTLTSEGWCLLDGRHWLRGCGDSKLCDNMTCPSSSLSLSLITKSQRHQFHSEILSKWLNILLQIIFLVLSSRVVIALKDS